MTSSDSSDEDDTWVKWFCNLRGNEFLIEVEEDYIQDRFNLTGLNEQVPHFKRALEIITDMDEDVDKGKAGSDLAQQAAELLYELIHARFLLSPRGMQIMANRYKNSDYGMCPRWLCDGQACLPVGTSDVPGEGTVKLFCPKCRDIYIPNATKSARPLQLDGAFFGTGFPSMLLLSMPELRPVATVKKYEPKLYGFKIHPLGLKAPRKAAIPVRKQDSICSSYGGGGNTSTNTITGGSVSSKMMIVKSNSKVNNKR